MALHGDENYERKLRPLYDALDARTYKVRAVGTTAAAMAPVAALQCRRCPTRRLPPCRLPRTAERAPASPPSSLLPSPVTCSKLSNWQTRP
jgi:hypothetical protein